MRALWGHQRSCTGPLHHEQHAEQQRIRSSSDGTDGRCDDDSGGLLSDESEDDTRSITAVVVHGEHRAANSSRHSPDSCMRPRSVRDAAFEGLTRLRLDYNASNSQVDAVKDMMQEVIGCIMKKVAAKLERENNPLHRSCDLSAFLSTVGDPFVGMRSSYLEGKLRARKLPNLQPTARVLGYRSVSHTQEDGSIFQETRTDYVYDFDIKTQLEAMFKFNPVTCEDFLGSMDRWKVCILLICTQGESLS